jgi:hypothetical protein
LLQEPVSESIRRDGWETNIGLVLDEKRNGAGDRLRNASEDSLMEPTAILAAPYAVPQADSLDDSSDTRSVGSRTLQDGRKRKNHKTQDFELETGPPLHGDTPIVKEQAGGLRTGYESN